LRGEARKKRRAAARKELESREADREPSKRSTAIFAVCALGAMGLAYAGWLAITNRFWGGRLWRGTVTSEGILAAVEIDHMAEDGNLVDWRVVLIDPLTGERKARRVFGDDAPTCEEVERDFLWCRTDHQVRALRLSSLADQATWADMQKAAPALAGGITEEPLKVSGDALVVTANDGRVWSLHADPPGGVLGGQHAAELPVPARERSLHTSTGSLGLSAARGGPRESIVLQPAGVPASEVRSTCTETYLEPEFIPLRAPPGGATDSTLRDPEGGIVSHASSLDRATAHMLISRVGLDGCPLWSKDLGKGSLELATRAGGVLAIVGNFPLGHAVAIGFDLASGVERWRRAL